MCGIAGAFQSRGVTEREPVEEQLRCLDHRGPDSWGVYAGAEAAIGQTRLAIIDLITGDPPITDESGDIGVALNGEIYNYRELGEDLRRDGHSLATACDTEVIAHLAEQLDPVELASRLDGMFAFAVWDRRRHRLILGRDRVGKKPLYYWADGGRLVFGSEIKAVLAHPWVPRRLDPDSIPAYMTFGYVPSPRTFFAEIHSVPPGHVLTVNPDGTQHVERYWEPRIPGIGGTERLDVSLSEAAGELQERLETAVARRLVSDVPLGAFLSGGVDSSAVVAVMASVTDRPVLTFTIGFEDNEGFDERPYARLVAERFKTDHTEFVVKPDAVELIERLVWHYDQPFGDSSAIPTYLLAQLTRSHVTVALCGDGGDELFAGYERFAGALVLARYRQLPGAVRKGIGHAASRLPQRSARSRVSTARRFLERSDLDLPDAFLSWVSSVPHEWREAFLGNGLNWGIDDYRAVWCRSQGAELLDRLLDLNLRTYLLDDLLPKADRMSMAHALEVRSPFLDHELIEFALRLPPSARIYGTTLKRVLKHAMRDVLPAEILQRRKRGFGVPLDRWFRSELRGYLDDTLGSPDASLRSHVKPEALDRLLAQHQAGQANHGQTLWALLTLEVFLRREGW